MRGRLPRAGSATGTGALISINLGFRPVYVKVINTTQLATGEVVDGQTSNNAAMPSDGHTLLEVTAGTKSYIATNGITCTPQGFTIGTNSNLNTASDVIFFVAF